MENREEIQLSLIIVRHYIVMKLMSRKDCTAGNLILLITNAWNGLKSYLNVRPSDWSQPDRAYTAYIMDTLYPTTGQSKLDLFQIKTLKNEVSFWVSC